MSSTLIKRCCIAILAGAALSVSMDAKKATAQTQINTPHIDAEINACIQKAQTQGLTSQEQEYCQRLVELRQQLYEQIKNQHTDTIDQIDRIQNQEPIKPTYFGVGEPPSD